MIKIIFYFSKIFIRLRPYNNISATSIYQAIYEANLDDRLEALLLKLLEHNSSPNVQEPIRQFLINYQIMSDCYWNSYKNAQSYDEVLEDFYQFSKNQCTVIETLLEQLKITLDKDNIRKDLAVMLKDGFTF